MPMRQTESRRDQPRLYRQAATPACSTFTLKPWLALGSKAGTSCVWVAATTQDVPALEARDRKSTRLNSSHRCISYSVFCLEKKIERSVIDWWWSYTRWRYTSRTLRVPC